MFDIVFVLIGKDSIKIARGKRHGLQKIKKGGVLKKEKHLGYANFRV